MSVVDEVVARNARYAETYTGADLPRPPKLRLAVFGCMDGRINYHKLLGLEDGEAIVITNAGGMVTEEILRSLTIAERGPKVDQIMYVGHTDCGIANEDDKRFKDQLEQETGQRPSWSIAPLRDLEQYVRDNVAQIRDYPFIQTAQVRGFIFGIEDGRLTEVAV